jgi:predicted TIM-barrel fold metal-dependent hydrolase
MEGRERLVSPARGMGLFYTRTAQEKNVQLPEGTVVVSSDNHYPLVEDIWIDKFPAHLKDKAWRIWWDEAAQVHQLGANMQTLFSSEAITNIRTMEDHPGCKSLEARMRDLDTEGVEKEICYPQILGSFFKYPDYEVREWTFRIYNEYLAETQAKVPGRFYGVGIGNYWDTAACGDWVREAHRLGLKTFMLPLDPGERADGRTIYYSAREYDPMWAAAEELGMPVSFHVGEQVNFGDSPAACAPVFLRELGPSQFRKIFGELVFGGVLDRFPGLKVVFAEANIYWVPGLIQDAEMLFNTHSRVYNVLPAKPPEYYWHNNFYATFIADMAGFRLLDMIGYDRVMFSTDYPHNEGTYGFTSDAIEAVIEVSRNDDDIRAILGGTAIKIYNLD